MRLVDAVCRAMAVIDGWYEDIYPEATEFDPEAFQTLVATNPCPYPDDEGYPVGDDWETKLPFLSKPYTWFINQDPGDQIVYMEQVFPNRNEAWNLRSTLSQYVIDSDLTKVDFSDALLVAWVAIGGDPKAARTRLEQLGPRWAHFYGMSLDEWMDGDEIDVKEQDRFLSAFLETLELPIEYTADDLLGELDGLWKAERKAHPGTGVRDLVAQNGKGPIAVHRDPAKALLAFLAGMEAPVPARFVALVLLLHCNGKTGHTWPAVSTIEGYTGLGRRTVQRALTWLVDEKIIREVKPFQHGGDRYASRVFEFTKKVPL